MATVVGDLVVFLRANTVQFNAGMTNASAALTKMGKQMSSIGKMMTTRLALPMAVVGGAAMKMAMDFETSLQQIVGLVGVAQEQVNAWREDIIALAPTLGKTSVELGNAMFFITSAGLRGADALDALKASAKGASAGLGETATVADAATSAMNAYGAEALNAEMATAVLVATVREGKAEASAIAPVIGQIIPVAAELGVEFHEVGAAIAVMTRLGLNAAISATALRSTLATILKPTKQAKKEMANYGMTMGDLKRILKEEGLIALLTKLKETFGDNEESMQKVFRNVRALNGVLSIVGKNVDNNVKIFGSLARTTTDDLNNAFEVASQTAKFKLNAAMADVQNTFIELGEVVLPVVVPMIEKLGAGFKSLTGFLDRLSPVQRTMLANIGMTTIALGPLAFAFGKVSLAAGVATGAVAKWNVAMTATTASATAGATSVTAMANSLGIAYTATATGGAGMVATFTSLAKVTGFAAIGISTLSVALVAAAGAIGVIAGSFLRPFVNEFLRWIGVMDSAGAHLQSDIIDGVMRSDESFQRTVSTLNRLKKSLNLQGKEWDFVNQKTRVNAERIQMLTDKALKLNEKRVKTLELVKEIQTAEERAADVKKTALEAMPALLAQSDAANASRLQALKEELGLYTSGDIADGMDGMIARYEDMKSLNIDQNQLASEFGDEMLEWLKLAKDNKVAIPAGLKAMGDDLVGRVNPAINKMLVHWKEFHHDARATGKILDGIWMGAGTNAQKALAGGFEKGIKEGIEKGGIALQDFVQRIEDTTIYIEITPEITNMEEFNQAVQDAVSGQRPDLTG